MTSGIPDCDFGASGVGGWVELKTYDSWPRDPNTPLKFSDLKPTQVNWMAKRVKHNPRVWFLVEVSEDWFLISGRYARQLGKMTRDELLAASDLYGSGSIDKKISRVFTKT